MPATAQPVPQPQDGARQKRAEHCAGRADQGDIATTAITDLVAAPGAKCGATQDGGDDPGGQMVPRHPHILASWSFARCRGLPTLGK